MIRRLLTRLFEIPSPSIVPEPEPRGMRVICSVEDWRELMREVEGLRAVTTEVRTVPNAYLQLHAPMLS
jgi:hypothetical protein